MSGLILGFAFLVSSLGHARVLTAQYDNARTGANLNERMLTPRNVNVTQFGKLFAFKVDGDVYAQPLYMPDLEVPAGDSKIERSPVYGSGEKFVVISCTRRLDRWRAHFVGERAW